MKKPFLIVSVLLVIGLYSSLFSSPPQERKTNGLQIVPFSDVDVIDEFWAPRQETNQKVTIPYNFKKFAETNDISHKDIEAALHALAKHPDPELEGYVNGLIERIVSSLSGGKGGRGGDPLNLGSGHFFELAAARFLITGKKDLLDVAVRSAEQIAAAYGPEKRRDVPEHQGIEVGLIRLYRATGEERYWKLAKFFLDERGKAGNFFGRTLYGEYAQDHKPVIEQDQAVGHAVRATFMYAGMADVAAIDGDTAYIRALDRIWEDVVRKKLYLTGSFGPRRLFEGFGDDYELPNLTCWNETCAAFGNVIWNSRLSLLHQDAKYIDVLERTLYNGFLAGVSLSGDRFFYQNLLKSIGNFERSAWFGVPCCPPNVARLLASLGDYIYLKTDDSLYINLFIGNRAKVGLKNNTVWIKQETRYPWDGAVRIAVDPEKPGPFRLYVRIPGWAQNAPVPGDLYKYMDQNQERASLKINGKFMELSLDKGFARVERTWKKGDVVDLNLPMPVRRVLAHEKVKNDEGLVALERGPVVYCAEWPDNGGRVLNLVVPDDAKLQAAYRKDLLNGVGIITGKVVALDRGKDGVSMEQKTHPLVAIPYYAWANRGPGEMAVWLARVGSKAKLPPAPTIASTSRVTASPNRGSAPTGSTAAPGIGNFASVCDQAKPVNSSDDSSGYLRLIPAEGSMAWVQYDFERPAEVSSAGVYWLDDKRFCRLPESWRVLYKDGGTWRPVAARGTYPIVKDAFNRIAFDPVRTNGLRLEIQAQKRLYFDGEIGPPSGDFIQGGPLEWHECGLIEWEVAGNLLF